MTDAGGSVKFIRNEARENAIKKRTALAPAHSVQTAVSLEDVTYLLAALNEARREQGLEAYTDGFGDAGRIARLRIEALQSFHAEVGMLLDMLPRDGMSETCQQQAIKVLDLWTTICRRTE